jgi:hypothetical protein
LLHHVIPRLDWQTPDPQGEEGAGESGALLEERLFRGKLIAVLQDEDVKREDRFKRIEEVYLQPTMGAYSTPSFDPIFTNK